MPVKGFEFLKFSIIVLLILTILGKSKAKINSLFPSIWVWPLNSLTLKSRLVLNPNFISGFVKLYELTSARLSSQLLQLGFDGLDSKSHFLYW